MRIPLLRHAGSRLLSGQPDEVLVRLAHAGHEPAFEAIVIRYGRYLLRVARAAGPEDRAEDVVQQALLHAYRALCRHEQVVELKPWLRRIVLNASVDLARRTGPRADAVHEEELAGESLHSVLERRQQVAMIVRALGDLPDRQRKAIVMRELEGRPFEEIASEFGTSNGAARQLVSRARARLRTGVAVLIPPVLLARISQAAELAPASKIAVGTKVGTAVAVGGCALAVGPLAPTLDPPARQPPLRQPAARGHTAKVDHRRPATTPRPRLPVTARPAPIEARRPAPAPSDSQQQGNHEGGDGQPAAAGESHAGQSGQVRQGGGNQD